MKLKWDYLVVEKGRHRFSNTDSKLSDDLTQINAERLKDLLLFGAVNTIECPDSEADDFFAKLDLEALLSRGEI